MNEGKHGVITSQTRKSLESHECKILWDFSIQTINKLELNNPDIVVHDKENRKVLVVIIDSACPFDTSIAEKVKEKISSYSALKYELSLQLWELKKCTL